MSRLWRWRRVPDASEPLAGYRMWTYTLRPGRIQLHSLSCGGGMSCGADATCGWGRGKIGTTWATASCRLGRHRRAGVPAENCSCGFYAMRTLDRLLEEAPLPFSFVIPDLDPDADEDMVLGRVELAGKVIEHEHGFRAEKARVAKLLPFEGAEPKVRRLASRMGVPMGPSVGLSSAPELVPFEPRDDRFGLNDREEEILRLVKQGRSLKEVSRYLCIERDTVNAHMYSIFEKLRTADRLPLMLSHPSAGRLLLAIAEVGDQAFDQARPSGTPPSWGGFSLN